MRILIRTNRRFFSDGSSFCSEHLRLRPGSEKPDNFLLVEINVEGYFTCRQAADTMQKVGYVLHDVFVAIKSLARAGSAASIAQSSETARDE